MKLTISTIKKGKEGDGQHGHWTMHNLTFPSLKIFEQDGTPHDFTKANTFEDSAATLQPGDTIEFEPEISDKGYLGLKKIVKVDGTAPAPTKETPQASKTSTPVKSNDDRIAEQVAVKAVVELAAGKVIEASHPLVSAAKAWCTDKLRGYLSSFPTETAKQTESPASVQPGGKAIDCGVDMEVLREMFPKIKWTDGTAMSWLEFQFKPLKRKATLEETIASLTPEQKEKFVNHVSNSAAG